MKGVLIALRVVLVTEDDDDDKRSYGKLTFMHIPGVFIHILKRVEICIFERVANCIKGILKVVDDNFAF